MALEVAKGYVVITPKVGNAKAEISKQMDPASNSAAKQAGSRIAEGISNGASKGAQEAGERLREKLVAAGKTAGTTAGDEIAKELSKATGKSDLVARDVQARLTDSLGKVTGAFRDVGTSATSSFGRLVSAWREMGDSFSSALSSSKVGRAFSAIGSAASDAAARVGRAFSAIGSAASDAAARVTGTFKGVGAFVVDTFSPVASKVGSALKGVASVASSAFRGLTSVVGGVVGGIGQAFGSLAGTIGSVLSPVTDALGGAFAGMATLAATGAAAAATAVGAIGKSALDAFGDYQQLSGGIQLALGDATWSVVEERSKHAFENVQMSQNAYLEQVNFMATGLRESMGGNAEAAATLADRVITTQADVVSAMGITQEAAQNAFNGIMKGNFTMLDNLGLGIKPTKEGFQEVIDKMNEWNATQSDRTATNYQIDNLADCQSALADYVEYLGLAGYAMDEGASTVQGSLSKMSAAWTDWMAELGKSDGDMGRVTGNLAKSFQDVATTVTPVLVSAVSAAVQELPGVVATVGPELASALVQIVDGATGGMATKAIEFVSPVTDALRGAFEGVGEWVGANEGPLSELGTKLGDFGGQLMESLGGAIEAAGPVVEGFADAALPALSSGLDLASGALTAAKGALSALGTAFKPVTDALGPVAEAIGGKVCDALSDLGGWLGSLDFDGFASRVSDVLQGVVDFCGSAFDSVTGFFSDVASFLADPIGSITAGFEGMVDGARNAEHSVASSFDGVASSVGAGVGSAMADIGAYNGTELEGKSSTAEVTGNVASGVAETSTRKTTKAIDGLYSKSVSVEANGNAATGSAASNVWSLHSAISSLFSKSVDVVTNNITRNVTQSAAGHVFRRHADGIIATRPLMTSVGLVGEAGAEAIVGNQDYTGVFPLTNRKYTGPFSNEISDQVVAKLGAGRGDTINVTVNAGDGGDEIARAITRELRAYQLMRDGR